MQWWFGASGMVSSSVWSFYREAVGILFLLFFKELNMLHLLQPHEGWRASIALLCPTMHTPVFYIPLQFSGWPRATQSGRFCLCFYLAKCTNCTSPGSRSSSGFILMWIQGTVLSRACSIVLGYKTVSWPFCHTLSEKKKKSMCCLCTHKMSEKIKWGEIMCLY